MEQSNSEHDNQSEIESISEEEQSSNLNSSSEEAEASLYIIASPDEEESSVSLPFIDSDSPGFPPTPPPRLPPTPPNFLLRPTSLFRSLRPESRISVQRTRPLPTPHILPPRSPPVLRPANDPSSSSDEAQQEEAAPNDEWQDLQLLQVSDKGRAVFEQYGSFPAILYWRLKKRNVFKPTSTEGFMDEFIKCYLKNAANLVNSPSSMEKIKGLAAAIPRIDSLKALMKYHRFNSKNSVFFKLAVDIMACYYKATGSPLFEKYKEEVIPTALMVYKTLPPHIIQQIYEKLSSHSTSRTDFLVKQRVGSKKYMVLYKNKDEYIKHYKNEALEYDNLTAGNTLQTFYV